MHFILMVTVSILMGRNQHQIIYFDSSQHPEIELYSITKKMQKDKYPTWTFMYILETRQNKGRELTRWGALQ